MARRSLVGPDEICTLENLATAFASAARGRRTRLDVQDFACDLDRQLERLQRELAELTLDLGDFRAFRIHDPKPRVIHAPSFRERIIHHAVCAYIGPVIDRGLIADTYACREGKGSLAAVKRAQRHARRFPFYVKTDVRSYFASISHERLRDALGRRFENAWLLELLDKIISGYEVSPGRGLPIGALTSQHFANFFLDPLDRYILEELRADSMVRYMDDLVWWTRDRCEARRSAAAVRAFAEERLELELKRDHVVQRSARGLSFLGFRVFPGRLLLGRRRRRRYVASRTRWERAYRAGAIDALELQRGYAACASIVAHADAAAFCRADLARRPEPDA